MVQFGPLSLAFWNWLSPVSEKVLLSENSDLLPFLELTVGDEAAAATADVVVEAAADSGAAVVGDTASETVSISSSVATAGSVNTWVSDASSIVSSETTLFEDTASIGSADTEPMKRDGKMTSWLLQLNNTIHSKFTATYPNFQLF
ncbi:hypothetical protein HK100_002002 [Physocladia obscura]|uniref:Uncharacterized protein n=1 Tax=Physocladia obscura TaxID=109957 RepID=A0AAD5XAM4_9FUNG|nr:hypothetical protein HK100_002002 [Physocladia obscura]